MRLLALAILLLLITPAAAAPATDGEEILFPAGYALSPDGLTLVFSWHGDLWRASSSGGEAVRLTTHPAVDAQPHVSPDGKTIAFVSNRSGHDQVWLMPFEGGTPTRLTTHTEPHRLQDWYPDGQALLVRQARDHHWRRADRLWQRSVRKAAKPDLLFDDYGYAAAVAPDGRRVAFTREGSGRYRKQYRGSQASQVWIHDSGDGVFTRVTKGDHEERYPLWAPDGRHLYVTSQESGTFNLVRHDLESGARTALTRFDGDGALSPAIAADGSVIVFQRLGRTWRLTPASGVAHAIELFNRGERTAEDTVRLTLKDAKEVAFTDDGKEIAFVAGGDLYVMDTELREPKRVTDVADQVREPMFSRDHRALYFIRDANGRPDIWVTRRGDEGRFWWQNDAFSLERITEDPDAEWALWHTPDGKRLSFLRNGGELWTMKPDGTDRVKIVDAWNPPWYSFSPDGQWVAYAVDDEDFNSDVWITKADGTGEPFNVSRHPDHDGSPAFSPDGKLLAFTSKRAGDDTDVHYVWLRREDEDRSRRDRTLEKALRAMKGRKTKPKPPAPAKRGPLTGTWYGLARGDGLHEDGIPVTLTIGADGSISLHAEGLFEGEPYYVDQAGDRIELAIVTPLGRLDAAGGTRQKDRLEGSWKLEDGREGTFELQLQRHRDLAAKPKPRPKPNSAKHVAIDFDGLEDRLHRIAIPNSSERGLLWSPDGKKLYFQATVDGKGGMYSVSIPDATKPKLFTTTRGRGGRWLPGAKRIGWLVGGKPATMDVSGRATSYAFEVRQVKDVGERHAALFDQAWRVIGDSFYDPRLNGRDWSAVRTKYRPLALRTRTASEIDAVVEMMLGELNGSHLGFGMGAPSWSAPGWRDETAHLGLRFDPGWPGPGLRVRDVVPDTPASRSNHRVEPGEVVLRIDDRPVDPSMNLALLLTGDPKRFVTLTVRDADGAEREVRMQPTSYRAVRSRLYEPWLDHNRDLVTALSEGRFGYLHVRGMSWSSFRAFEEAIYEVGYGKDGLVIDVRDNGGGFTADHLLTALTQPAHAFTIGRGGKPGYPQDRMVYARWTKPIVVLCNQNSFSNAEIFAHAIRTLGRGKVVGVPTAGGVISTGGTDLMGLAYLRLPFRGWFTLPDGEDMERRGCPVDVLVWPEPGELPSGKDRQLEAAVEALARDVQAWAARPRPKPRYASER